jgi:opacity protein-like surface antigen
MRSIGFVALAFASLSAPVALAADLPEGLPPAPVLEYTSNWYARVDAGYGFMQATNGSDLNMTPGGKPVPFLSNRVDDGGTFGAGIGFRKDWFRADITFDVGTGSKFYGNSAAFSPDVTARIWNYTTLANGYFDLGTWYGFTPYIGGGLGFSVLKATQVTDQAVASAGGSVAGPGSVNYDFAWAANAGVAYSVTRNIFLDLSYRYLDMGTPRSNVSNVPNGGVATVGTITFGDVTAHQVRLGLRYQLD